MKKIWDWFVKSSADPSKTALTVKGIIVLAIPLIVQMSGVLNEAELNQFADNVAIFVQALLMAAGAVMSFVGFVRKVMNSFA